MQDVLPPFATRKDIIAYYSRHPTLIDRDVAIMINELHNSLGIVDTRRYENLSEYVHAPDERDIDPNNNDYDNYIPIKE